MTSSTPKKYFAKQKEYITLGEVIEAVKNPEKAVVYRSGVDWFQFLVEMGEGENEFKLTHKDFWFNESHRRLTFEKLLEDDAKIEKYADKCFYVRQKNGWVSGILNIFEKSELHPDTWN